VPKEFMKGRGVDETSHLIKISNLDTMCNHCFAPADEVYYNTIKKTLLVVCVNGHQSNIEGNWVQILGIGE